VSLSPRLYQDLAALQPPFSSINEIERFAKALHRDATARGDATAVRAASRLLAAATRFDVEELTQQLSALKRGTRTLDAVDTESSGAEPR
jgi:hypothetical protein